MFNVYEDSNELIRNSAMKEIQFVTDKHYKVMVCCYTYNHSLYIREALNGFASQDTSFPFVCLIVDDNSNDGEQEVLKAFLHEECNMQEAECLQIGLAEIIIVPHKDNPNCTFVMYFLKQNLYNYPKVKNSLVTPWRQKCLYEALCEGDDYWTDSNKLQREATFLDENPSYSMIAENGLVVNSIKQQNYPFSTQPSRDIENKEEILRGRKFPTAGVLLRMKESLGVYDFDFQIHDTMLWCWMLSKGKIYYSDVVSSVYRRGMQGVCESTEHYKFGQAMEQWNINIMNIFNIQPKFIYGTIARSYKYTMMRALGTRSYWSALKSGVRMTNYLLKSIVKA